MQRLLLLLCASMLLSSVSGGPRSFTIRRYCPPGWTSMYGRCFKYVGSYLTWAQAEKNCLHMKGNLASVRSMLEYYSIQNLILRFSHRSNPTWIGGYDATEEGVWLWSDGSLMTFTKWCPGEPNNGYGGRQHCLQMNYSGRKCWDDHLCNTRLPSVCIRKKKWFGA
ncbi:ladderlectin [Austrofundulus limnaeus]|uniref:Ladderlectin n=1 Tax=Austrofundulus limnaeus TaxID=52670 RepID=A0A2I4D0N1_AUSLI|nr:PREDICTED: ladderlectin-like [Austrofundulus limnaeus]